MTEPMVGDTVLIRGTVMQVSPGVGVRVELFSKTDQYEVWIRPSSVERVLLPEAPQEPPDGTWLVGRVGADGNGSVFRRDDGEGHHDTHGGPLTRRHDRRWWDYAAGEWVDWPEAFRRGADPDAQLLPDGARHLGRHEIEEAGYCRSCGVHHSPEEIARLEDRLAEEDRDGQ